MKKLMIAACAVAFAAVAQAATFDWGFTSDSIEDPSGEYIEGGTAELWVNAVLIATGGQNDDFTFGEMNATSDKLAALPDGSISGTFEGQAYKLVLKYTDGDGQDWEATFDGVSSYRSVAGAIGEKAKNYEVFATDYAIAAGDWNKVTPTPEPTTGLLMLVGLAGLALRRRRA